MRTPVWLTRLSIGLSVAAPLAWSIWWLLLASRRWRLEAVCAYSCPPYIPADLVDTYRHAFDWQTPLVWAALPWLVLPVAWLLLRRWRRTG